MRRHTGNALHEGGSDVSTLYPVVLSDIYASTTAAAPYATTELAHYASGITPSAPCAAGGFAFRCRAQGA